MPSRCGLARRTVALGAKALGLGVVLLALLVSGGCRRERPIARDAQSQQVANVPEYVGPNAGFSVKLAPNPAMPPGYVPASLTINNQSRATVRVGYSVGAERRLYLSVRRSDRFMVSAIGDTQCSRNAGSDGLQCRGSNGMLCTQIFLTNPIIPAQCEGLNGDVRITLADVPE